MDKKIIVLILAVIIVVASFFRLTQLESFPPGLYPDEAINGNQAYEEPGKVFYGENNGREGLFMNLLAISFYFFGVSISSFKAVSAFLGILTVIGLYFLTKELFKFEPIQKANFIALAASFLLAVSFWHTVFSRIGFRAILVPFVLVWALFFLLKAMRTDKIRYYIFSGIFWGLGFHTYIAYRVAPLIPAIVLSASFLNQIRERAGVLKLKEWGRVFIQKQWWKVSFLVIATILVALPLGIYFLQNPADFMSRAKGVSIFAQDNPLLALGKSAIIHLGMFNIYGDPNWRHNYAGEPMLPWSLGILFLAGLFLSFKELFKSFAEKKYQSFTVNSLLISWFVVMLLPGMLTAEGLPHALRVIGIIPVVYIFVALGVFWLWNLATKILRKKFIVNLLLIVFLICIGWGEYHKYFLDWGLRQEVKDAFSERYVDIGKYLNSLPIEIEKYLIVNELGTPQYGISIPGQTIIFIENAEFGYRRTFYISTDELDRIKVGKNEIVIIPLYELNMEEKLKEMFPEGKIENEKGFWVYKIN
ncbi:MAG: glycosyltransferase family 39 protein [bacterium]